MNTETLEAVSEILSGLSSDVRGTLVWYFVLMAVVPIIQYILTAATILLSLRYITKAVVTSIRVHTLSYALGNELGLNPEVPSDRDKIRKWIHKNT